MAIWGQVEVLVGGAIVAGCRMLQTPQPQTNQFWLGGPSPKTSEKPLYQVSQAKLNKLTIHPNAKVLPIGFTKKIRLFGTPRVCHATHISPQVLTRRAIQDAAQQVSAGQKPQPRAEEFKALRFMPPTQTVI